MTNDFQLADRIAWGRARGATVLAAIFIATQIGSFHNDASVRPPRNVELASLAGWGVALLVFFAVGSGLFRGAQVRALLNDESTLDHRRRAMVLGFWAALLGATGLYVLGFFTEVPGREGLRLVITLSIVVALLRFGTLEKKALKDG
jgi:hypothetical protein